MIPSGVLNHLTKLVIVNAIYFKGEWVHAFDSTRTSNAPFYTSEARIDVSMMTMKETFKYAEDDDIQIVQLPYKGNDLSMYIFLPNARDSFEHINHISSLKNLESFRFKSQELNLSLPKFKMSSEFELSSILKDMGMSMAFSSNADFSGISDEQVFLSSVIHKAVVSVDEKGTEAAAATAASMMRCCKPTPKEFKVDHPFLFVIRHEPTKTILFMGRVTDPS